ncbi:SEC-C metal-binding domain-containing protein [Planomonospora sp. ID82291]|uniref:SEC-C metal-binding domain-containing protein n=1 Tax=Planomonospora sp. ID82291 TaxID=2738136 RepID=UPI0018C3B9D7|nr:SEC-C metal-binding domain-containing protein [Planomonospora sp. ID82291]MBG0816927.1 SEC-C domain-containing protein [Planomonospora sp. ID82291]
MPAKNDLVSLGDIEFALPDALKAGSPDPVVARLLAAVDDPSRRDDDFEPAFAMVAVSGVLEDFGRLEEALATLRRADAEGIRDDRTEPKAWIAALLVKLGRTDEAAEVFQEVRRAGRDDWSAYEIYGESVEETGDLAGALKLFASGEARSRDAGDGFGTEQLGTAVGRVRRAMGFPDEAPPPEPSAVRRLLAEDHGLGTGGYDLEADDHDRATTDVEPFWPRADFERLLGRWPSLAESEGADWDAHRAEVETGALEAGELDVRVALLRCSFEDFASFAERAGGRPDADTVLAYAESRGPDADLVPWPPERNAPCWCGSGRKYKQCCRPRGFASPS